MDRLTQLRGEAGGSRDSTLDTSAALSEAYVTANDSSKFFSLTEEDSSFDISPIKDVSLASTAVQEKTTGNDQLMSDLSPIPKKKDLLDSYKFGKQIEAANILSGGVDIFDDNDNSYDGDELVIDDNVVEIDEKSNTMENSGLPFQKSEEDDSQDGEPAIASKDTEVVLQIDGKNVNAIDIGNGLYLYRKAGEEELAAVQIVADDQPQPTFKFLKVRENAEGNLEVYEEIEVEVPKEPIKEVKTSEKNTAHLPIKDINKVISDSASNKVTERKKIPQDDVVATTSNIETDDLNKVLQTDTKSEINLNGKMVKFNETRKSPVIHSTPNKEGIPLTKTMVDMQLHPSRQLDNVKTIEVHTESSKQKSTDTQVKTKDIIPVEDNKVEVSTCNKNKEISAKKIEAISDNTEENMKTSKELITEEPNKKDLQDTKKVDRNLDNLEVKPVDSPKIFKSGDKDSDIDTTLKILDKGEKKQDPEPTLEDEEQQVKTAPKNEKQDIVTAPNILRNDTKTGDENIGKDIIVEKSKQNIISEETKEDRNETSNELSRTDQPINKSPEKSVGVKKDNIEQTKQNLTVCKLENDNKINEESKTVTEIKETDQKVISINDNIKSKHTSLQEKENEIIGQSEIGKIITVVNEDNTKKPIINLMKQPSQTIEAKNTLKEESTKTVETILTESKNVEQMKITQSSIPKDSPASQNKQTKVEEKYPVVSKEQSKTELTDSKKHIADNPANSETSATDQPTLLKEEILKTQYDLVKSGLKASEAAASIQNTMQSKSEVKKEITKITNIEQKSINNNHAAVPFGKWTEANRQEFLNKFKEIKVPTSTNTSKSLKQANDLNRRDVLQKIDSQRQSSNASSKGQEHSKLNVKNETVTFVNKSRETKVPVKTEAPVLKNKPTLSKKTAKPELPQAAQKLHPNSSVTISIVAKQEAPQRKEINNQDLIDKTIEGIINRAVTSKTVDSNAIPKESAKTQNEKPSSSLDAIEMKMNELHGIPFIERPPHELPKAYNRDIKTYSKTDSKAGSNKGSKIPNLLPFSNTPSQKEAQEAIIDLDSEEEVIEHEPITGDIDLHKTSITPNLPVKQVFETKAEKQNSDASKKETIITEKDFDKFARRNSITYENFLTVNFEGNKQHNVIQGLVAKDIIVNNPKIEAKNLKIEALPTEAKTKSIKQKILQSNNYPHQIQITSKLMPVNEEVLNKNYQSKLQLAYQTALTAKRQLDPPITIIEDKPVKVVFMESTTDLPSNQLNVLGQRLSPIKKQVPDTDAVTVSTCDSLDSDVLDANIDDKAQIDNKVKTKHQRKQVLTPVETPELELIVPSDLGVEVSPKKKRKIEEIKPDKSAKSLIPKKSYLLGRTPAVAESVPQDLTKTSLNQHNPVISHKDTASAIDNLVKAAELLETQSENMNVSSNISISNSDGSQQTPVKRGRGRPRKNPLPEGTPDKNKVMTPQCQPRLIDAKQKQRVSSEDNDTSDDEMLVKENWTMGKINENIVCPICSKLFRSENVVFKHVKHCTGPSPNRSESDKRSPRSRLSRESDSKSLDNKSDDMNQDTDQIQTSKKNPKKRNSIEISTVGKDDIIVIEDTPVKENVEKTNGTRQQVTKKPIKTKAQYKTTNLSCEHCGKTFRQLSYLVSHKLLHKKDNPKVPENNGQVSDKSVFSCEVCKKEFRKLHHLVQHRIIHKPQNVASRPSRKSSSEQNVDNKVLKEDSKQSEDQSAAFRCEPCDKSFRKLHHLVEHRETHDGINRQKTTSTTQATVEKVPNPPPQCDVCKKTFRKLHHLIEHKEQHLETSSEKSDDKSVRSSLSTKDIIHECPLCYMVFPNEHSLNKHSIICQRKKKQSALKQAEKQLGEAGTTEGAEIPKEDENTVESSSGTQQITETEKPLNLDQKSLVDKKVEEPVVIQVEGPPKEEEMKPAELTIVSKNGNLEELVDTPAKETQQIINKVEEKSEQELKVSETPKNKVSVKNKESISVAKRRKSNLPLAAIKESATAESSDDDEIRYMLNPDFKEENSEGKVFMKVRAKKRNSLQFERPISKDLVKRRTSLQHPPKILRLKNKLIVTSDIPANPLSQTTKLEPVPSTDSDDSDVKYSFPEKPPEKTDIKKTPKEKKKTAAEKRKSLMGIARRKSLVKSTTVKQKESPVKVIKRRRAEVEHRCDCGQLFNSAALLARHTTLAHTPPRVRRRRVESPSPAPLAAPPAPRNSTSTAGNKAGSRKSSIRSDVGSTTPSAKLGRPAGKTSARTPGRKSTKSAEPTEPAKSSALKRRKSSAHKGVPVPEKMKKMMEKLRK